jgi:hypothetical protein
MAVGSVSKGVRLLAPSAGGESPAPLQAGIRQPSALSATPFGLMNHALIVPFWTSLRRWAKLCA